MSLSHYLSLVVFKTYADLKTEAAKTYISFVWWLVEPVLNMAVFYLVFGVLLQRRTEDYTVFLLVGLVVWKWFASTVTHGSGAILTNVGLSQQVYFPKAVLPAVMILSDTVKFLFTFIVLVVLLVVFGVPVAPSFVAIPYMICMEALFITAVTLFVSAIVPFLPDVTLLLENILFFLFFSSGVFFEASNIPPKLREFFLINPMATFINEFRRVLLKGLWPDWGRLALIGTLSFLAILIALRILRRFDRVYPRLMMP